MRACTQTETHACFVQVLCVLYNKARLRQVFIISQRSSGNGRSHFVREHLFGKCSLFVLYLQSVGQSSI